jgi:immunoglobulin-binding protein 1
LNILIRSHNNGETSNQAQHEANKKASNVMPLDQKKPFIITKSQLQAQVFGAGYPSLPVYSIEQFYDQLAERGLMPDADAHHHQEPKGPVQIGGGVTDTQKDEEKAQKDLLEDRHDEEQLRKEREWDEFKDEHKRGSGNRFNRS